MKCYKIWFDDLDEKREEINYKELMELLSKRFTDITGPYMFLLQGGVIWMDGGFVIIERDEKNFKKI